MMQIVRCESAVAQGLRSDKHPKCDEREQSNFHSPHSLWPASCRPPLSTSLAPKCSQISNNWCNTNYFIYIQPSAVFHPAQCFQLQTKICMTSTPRPLPLEMLRELRVCQSGVSDVLRVVVVCSCFPWPFGRRSSEMTLPRARWLEQH